jgi:hypothetical protein
MFIALPALFGTPRPEAVAAPAPAIEYIFVPEPNKRAKHMWVDGRLDAGTIDSTGEFHMTGHEDPPNDHYGPFVMYHPKPIRAYEFRSGKLVPGTLMPEGKFVPEPGAKVIWLEDYKPERGFVYIWNLPGTYMRKDKFNERRKWLAEHMAENPNAYGKEKARLDAAVEGKR